MADRLEELDRASLLIALREAIAVAKSTCLDYLLAENEAHKLADAWLLKWDKPR